MKVKLKELKGLLPVLLLCAVLTGCSGGEESPAVLPEETPIPSLELPELPAAAEKREYEEARIYFDGILAGRGYIKDGLLYIPPECIAAHYGFELEVEADEKGFILRGATLDMQGEKHARYMQANGRYLYTPEGYLLVGGRLCLSADVTERVFGINVTVFGEPMQAEISGDKPVFISGGPNYYDINFDSQDVYWLTQIIYAEARDEPLEGLIAVGNVVCNRVNHELYPDTVFEVIFDREYAVQFDPVFTGGIHEQPDERSRIAALLCLEGYNTAGESLFFVNPQRGDATWVSENRVFVCSIGNHDFYA